MPGLNKEDRKTLEYITLELEDIRDNIDNIYSRIEAILLKLTIIHKP